MNEMIQQVVGSTIDAFSMYEIKSPALQREVDDYKARLTKFAEQNNDLMAFYSNYAASGLQEEYSALITKVAMASMGTANEDGQVKTDYSEDEPTPVVSVREFVEQYRASYDAVRQSGYRKRAEAAYEEIFAVADRTDDMLDAQYILEQERLLWKIVSLDSLDIFEPLLEALDPLQPATTITTQLQIESYRQARSEEELNYLLERGEHEKVKAVTKAEARMQLAASLATQLVLYAKVKRDVYSWHNEMGAKGGVAAMVRLRQAARRTLYFLQQEWGMTFEDLLADEGMKIWMLSPQSADEFGRVKTVLHEHNYEAYRDMVNNEILSELSISEILLRDQQVIFWPDLNHMKADRYNNRAEQRARQLNSSLTYYRYRNQINAAQKTMPGAPKAF